jgi:hypothetical protein
MDYEKRRKKAESQDAGRDADTGGEADARRGASREGGVLVGPVSNMGVQDTGAGAGAWQGFARVALDEGNGVSEEIDGGTGAASIAILFAIKTNVWHNIIN